MLLTGWGPELVQGDDLGPRLSSPGAGGKDHPGDVGLAPRGKMQGAKPLQKRMAYLPLPPLVIIQSATNCRTTTTE